MPPQRLPPVYEPLAALLRGLIEPLPLYHGVAPSFDDAVWVGSRLIELLPLEVERKQALLEMPDAIRRLEALAAALDQAASASTA